MLHIEPKAKAELLAIMAWYKKYDVRAYGACVKTRQAKVGFLELCIMNTISPELFGHLQKTFSLSDLPFFVRLEFWNELSKVQQNSIKPDLLPLDQW